MANIGIVTSSVPTSEDNTLLNRLISRGHTVSFVDHAAPVPAGYELFLITANATALDADAKYKLIDTPVMTLRLQTAASLALASNSGATTSSSTVYGINTGHEIGLGFDATSTILNTAQVQQGVLQVDIASGASMFASTGPSSIRFVGWTVDVGRSLVGGVLAPKRRLMLHVPIAFVSDLTQIGWSLFDKSVDWCLNLNEFQISGTENFTWVDSDGGQIQLNVLWEVDGRYMPTVEFQADLIPGRPGRVFRSVRHDVRELSIPIWIVGSSEIDLQNKVRALVASMDPTRGIGRLQCTNVDGARRQVWVRYHSGLSMPEKLGDTSGPRVQKVTINFIAHDPYWEDVEDTVRTFTVGLPPTFFPFFPMNLASSTVIASEAIDNEGDVVTWPVWKIVGPGSEISLLNNTTGEKLEFSNSGGLTLGNGEWIDIDTRPGVKTVRRNDGVNLFKYLSADSSMWALARGANQIDLQMSTSTSASQLVMSYRQRYLSP